MGWKDLQKIILQNNTITSSNFDIFEGLPFWIWDSKKHRQEDIRTKGHCCFNHVLGLPRDNNDSTKINPLFDYQQTIFDSLLQSRHLWILKSTGLGISEFFLRYMSWLCLRNNDYQNSQMVIVTGPNIDLAIKLIRRMKRLFEPMNIFFDSKETVLELNKVRIESYPSNHIDSFRSLDNPKFILLDEADFFRKSEQEVRAVAERYIAKSNPYIILVSTPNMPEGLMQNIELESEETCLYHRIKLDYRYGLNKIYSIEDIEKARQSPSFDREYNLKYLGKVGNLYSQLSIQNAINNSHGIPKIEDPSRAVQQLYNLARGHALSYGRNYITSDDIGLVLKVVLSTGSIERVLILDLLIAYKGELITSQITTAMRISNHTAKRTMTEFKRLELVDMDRVGDNSNSEYKITLKSKFKWFLTDEFKQLREGFKPTDNKEFLTKKKSAGTKIPPVQEDLSKSNNIQNETNINNNNDNDLHRGEKPDDTFGNGKPSLFNNPLISEEDLKDPNGYKYDPEIINNIDRFGNSDTWYCKKTKCSVRGDMWYLMKHDCKYRNIKNNEDLN